MKLELVMNRCFMMLRRGYCQKASLLKVMAKEPKLMVGLLMIIIKIQNVLDK